MNSEVHHLDDQRRVWRWVAWFCILCSARCSSVSHVDNERAECPLCGNIALMPVVQGPVMFQQDAQGFVSDLEMLGLSMAPGEEAEGII